MIRSCPQPRTRRSLAPALRPASIAEALEERRLFAAFDVLVFSKTAGFRHQSIDQGISAIQALGAANDFNVVATESASAISDANLAQYEAVVFLSTTGDFLNDSQQDAFERYMAAGGGFVGIHAAADAEYDWPWYGGLIGAYFDEHPDVQEATINVADSDHPATEGLPADWTRTDEWYNYRTNPRTAGVNVLLTLDEDSYSGGTMGDDHPIAWLHEYAGGRAFYTGLGHTPASYSEALFRQHLLGGILYAANPQDTDSRPPTASASADRVSGEAPLAVAFSSAGTDPGDRGPVTYAWDFHGDGIVDSTAPGATFTYTDPGSFTARLVVSDLDGVMSEDTVQITATEPSPPPPPPNQAPITQPDFATTPRDTSVTMAVLANDTDNGAIDPASITFPSRPANGTVTFNALTGAVTYTPAAGFSGTDTFTYAVSDTQGESSAATSVTVTVTPTVTEPPVPPVPDPVLSVEVSGDLPVAVVAGGKAKMRQVVTIQNLKPSSFNNKVTISLYASENDSIDAQDVLLASTMRRLKLKPGASRDLRLRLDGFNSVAVGNYKVLAQASSPSAGDSNTGVSAATVQVAAPFRDLAPEPASAPSGIVKAGKRGVAKLLLRNDGNAPASGTLTLTLSAQSDAETIPLGAFNSRLKLKPDATKRLKVRFTLPTTPGVYTVIASILASPEVGESNLENNQITAGSFTVE